MPERARTSTGTSAGGSARGSAKASARTSAGHESGSPPRLALGLWERLRFLVVVNIIPIVGLSCLFFTWDHGPKVRPTLDPKTTRFAIGIVAACVVVMFSSWVLLPIARWLRDYPRWCYLHRSPLLWFLPTVLGFFVWVAMALVGFAAVVASLVVIISAFVHLLNR